MESVRRRNAQRVPAACEAFRSRSAHHWSATFTCECVGRGKRCSHGLLARSRCAIRHRKSSHDT